MSAYKVKEQGRGENTENLGEDDLIYLSLFNSFSFLLRRSEALSHFCSTFLK